MKKFQIYIIITVAFVCIGVFGVVQAQENITYPIPALGNCGSQEECHNYCEAPENHEACIAFAVDAGLMPPEVLEQVQRAKRLQEHVEEFRGPGECSSEEECEAYCEEPSNRDECFNFAVSQGYMSEEEREMIGERRREFEEGREEHAGIDRAKAARLIAEIGGPGGCSTMDECDAFCSDMSHAQICMEYAREHGLIRAEDVQKMEKHLEVMEKMELGELSGPGGCSTMRECETYCSDPSHMSECMDFAVEMGMMSEEQVEKMKEFQQRSEEMIRHMEEERMRMQDEFEENRFPEDQQEYPGNQEGYLTPSPHNNHMMPPEGFDGPTPEDFERYRKEFEDKVEEYRIEYEYEEEPMSNSLFRQLSAVISPLVAGLTP